MQPYLYSTEKKPKANANISVAVLTRLRFSAVAEAEPECGLLVLCVPLALLPLAEEEDEEGAGGGVRERREDAVEADDGGCFFFFLTGVGASYVRKDSKDMVGVSKSSSSSSGCESFGARGCPGKRRQMEVRMSRESCEII